ncbi:MAG: hypothetical protein J7494_06715 [Sphingobium sp.]|nr:hypothetical protein [Sphingobium sp.]
MISLLVAFLAMLLVPALIWGVVRYLVPASMVLRLAGAVALPPLIAVGLLALDAANAPDDKAIGTAAYFLVFIFPFIMSIGVAGFCEAWAGRKRS